MLWEDAEIQCPYCLESCWISVDPGGGSHQQYVEDCQVCCRPMTVLVTLPEDESEEVQVHVERENS